MVFSLTQLSKQSGQSHFNVAFFFPSFQDDSRLCSVEALKEYEARISQFPTNKAENRLFCYFIGKHKPVCSSRIARWIKTCLQEAGIDVTILQAHSTQAAKAALSGLTVEEIMSAVDWSSKGTFIINLLIQQHLVQQFWQPMNGLQNRMLIWRPSLPKYNFRMAQVMQWPPAICNYMRKVKSKYQHVPPIYSCIPFALTGFYIRTCDICC